MLENNNKASYREAFFKEKTAHDARPGNKNKHEQMQVYLHLPKKATNRQLLWLFEHFGICGPSIYGC